MAKVIWSEQAIDDLTNNEKIRELIEGNYRIIYEISTDEPDRVDILMVHHSSRPLTDR